MIIKRIGIFIGLCAWLALTPPVTAASTDPDILVKKTTDKVLAELASNRDFFMKDNSKLYDMVDSVVLPHFDFERMSKLVLGKHWRGANDEQRQKFVMEFKILLVRTYATALFQYNGQKIVYKPFHHAGGDEDAVVKTEIVPSDGPPIPMNYALSKSGDGNWRVFDIRIDGISLVTNYRTSYSSTIQNQGLDTLISMLAEKNKVIMQQ